MFKRMSVLVRREGDTRAQFSQGWLRHGRFIADLPGLRGYVQNHVEEEFDPPVAPLLRADGFVELRFDSPEAMALAFTSPAAHAMAADEPHFLGHGSGYALAGDDGLREAQDGNKLIVALGDGDPARVMDEIAALNPLALIRDDVTALIAKPYMAPPQPAQSFLHLHYRDAGAADHAARKIIAITQAGTLKAAIFRVRTVRFV